MKRPRRKTLPQPPPAPRIDPKGRRAEDELFTETFDALLWRRPTPL